MPQIDYEPYFEGLRQYAQKILTLLERPEPGLFAWWECLNTALKDLENLHKGGVHNEAHAFNKYTAAQKEIEELKKKLSEVESVLKPNTEESSHD